MNKKIKEILYYFEKYHFEDTMIDGKETKLLYDYITDLQNQLQQKENIIKEVRELANTLDDNEDYIGQFIRQDILDILDEVDKEK